MASEVHIDIYDDRMEIYSPGGMPDGSTIQERDPLSVPSTRRNPILADVFSRIGYMERKGSGFWKIINGYESQPNYDVDRKPTFRSNHYEFTVILPNLNYNVHEDVHQDVHQDVHEDVPQGALQDETEKQIIFLIHKEPRIKVDKIALILGLSSKTIRRYIKNMKNIHYFGSGYSGYWKIDD